MTKQPKQYQRIWAEMGSPMGDLIATSMLIGISITMLLYGKHVAHLHPNYAPIQLVTMLGNATAMLVLAITPYPTLDLIFKYLIARKAMNEKLVTDTDN